jgi:hypothetical protein
MLSDVYTITDSTPELLTNAPYLLENICFEGYQYEQSSFCEKGHGSVDRLPEQIVEILDSSDEFDGVVSTQNRSTDNSFCEMDSEEATSAANVARTPTVSKMLSTTQTWRNMVNEQQETDFRLLSGFLQEARNMASKKQHYVQQGRMLMLRSTDKNMMSKASDDYVPKDIAARASRKRCFHFYQNGSDHRSQLVAPIRMSNDNDALCKHVTCVPISKSFCVEDSKQMTYLPYLGEHVSEEEIAQIIETSDLDQSRREEQVKFGAECEEERLNRTIDHVLTIAIEKSGFGSSKQQIPINKKDILQSLQNISANDLNVATSHWDKGLTYNEKRQEWARRIQDRFQKLITKHHETEANESSTKDSHLLFLDTMDSYRKLWCRRCYVYDCNLHAVHDKMSHDVQQKLALRKEHNGHWIKLDSTMSGMRLESGILKYMFPNELTDFHRSICNDLYTIFEGDYIKMARVMRVRPEIIKSFVEANKALFELREREPQVKSRKDSNYYSVKNYNLAWYNTYGEKQIFPSFAPCKLSLVNIFSALSR